MTKLTLADFERMALKNRLVPMVIRRSFAPHFKGDVAGFPPQQALKLFEDGDAVPYRQPDAVPPQKPTATAAGKTPGVITTDDVNPPVIPENWQEVHHFSRVKLASEISGRSAKELSDEAKARSEKTGTEVKQSDIADEIIAAEVEARAKKG
jgi:hypothetical protein